MDFVPENGDEIRNRYSNTWCLLKYVPVGKPRHPFGQPIDSLIQRDPMSVLAAALSLEDDRLQQTVLGVLFSNWLLRDSNTAFAALPSIESRKTQMIDVGVFEVRLEVEFHDFNP